MRDKVDFQEEAILDGASEGTLLSRLYPLTRPYRLRILLSLFIVVAITLLELGLPYLTKTAIDRYIVPETTAHIDGREVREYRARITTPAGRQVISDHPDLFSVKGTAALISYENLATLSAGERNALREEDVRGLSFITLLFLAMAFLDFATNFVQKILMEYTGHQMMHDFRVALFRHVQSLSIAFFSKNPVGRLVTRVTNDIQNMHELFTTVITFLFNDVFLLLGITALLISISPKLTLVSFLVLPLVWLAATQFAKRARGIFRTLRVKTAEINTKFSETVAGMKVIQLFCFESQNRLSFEALNRENYRLGMAQIKLMSVFLPLIDVLGTTALATVLWYGGGRVLAEKITLGELVAFLSYIRMFFRPIRDVAEKYNILQDALSSAERIFLLMDSKEKFQAPEGPGDVPAPPFERLSFEGVSFSYVPEEPVLKDINFTLNAGETLGIVGATGAGKSTLIHLITRFFDPTAGKVLYNGKDLKDLPEGVYRPKTALIMQDPYLFSGTIAENILRGNPNASEQDLEGILAAAHCTDLVARAPGGLSTLLSESGLSLSSGERQLISIARALARNPDLILMDEATSHIDSRTEQQIQEAMANLMKHRTAVVVAHRLATVRHLSRILVIKDGEIIESGSHEQLLAQRGFYFRLHLDFDAKAVYHPSNQIP